MTEDLLTRIEREMNERLEALRGAVEEHDRLALDLRALNAPPEPPALGEGPPANVVRLAGTRSIPRTRRVSPKVARLMRAPRRPALERSGVLRVGAGRIDSFSDESFDEINAQAERY